MIEFAFGLMIGGFFAACGLKSLAPASLPGVLAILGMYIGYVLVDHFR